MGIVHYHITSCKRNCFHRFLDCAKQSLKPGSNTSDHTSLHLQQQSSVVNLHFKLTLDASSNVSYVWDCATCCSKKFKITCTHLFFFFKILSEKCFTMRRMKELENSFGDQREDSLVITNILTD